MNTTGKLLLVAILAAVLTACAVASSRRSVAAGFGGPPVPICTTANPCTGGS